jgi:hypothetical protein
VQEVSLGLIQAAELLGEEKAFQYRHPQAYALAKGLSRIFPGSPVTVRLSERQKAALPVLRLGLKTGGEILFTLQGNPAKIDPAVQEIRRFLGITPAA